MRCKRKGCKGEVVNLGWFYGCLLCSREQYVKAKRSKRRDLLHLGILIVERVKKIPKPDPLAPVKYNPRYVLVSRGEHYIGEDKKVED